MQQTFALAGPDFGWLVACLPHCVPQEVIWLGASPLHCPHPLCRQQQQPEPGQRQASKRRKGKICGTRPSRVVPHRSTTRARPCLTSLFGWEATHGDMAAYEESNYSFRINKVRVEYCSALFGLELARRAKAGYRQVPDVELYE